MRTGETVRDCCKKDQNMQNKNALIAFIAGRIYPGFAEDTRNTPMPASVTMKYAQSILRRHRDVLLEDGKLDELDAIDPQPQTGVEVEHAVVAGDCIMSVGDTPADAAEDYAATGLDVRSDGAGGWEALSVSDIDWQPVMIIEISAELAAHIRQHGAPDSWDTINGIAHLELDAA